MIFKGANNINETIDEIEIMQQHCGGTNVCVFKDFVRVGGGPPLFFNDHFIS